MAERGWTSTGAHIPKTLPQCKGLQAIKGGGFTTIQAPSEGLDETVVIDIANRELGRAGCELRETG